MLLLQEAGGQGNVQCLQRLHLWEMWPTAAPARPCDKLELRLDNLRGAIVLDIVMQSYRTRARLHLQYCVHSTLQGGVVVIERVQKRFTRLASGMKEYNHKERLDRFGLF